MTNEQVIEVLKKLIEREERYLGSWRKEIARLTKELDEFTMSENKSKLCIDLFTEELNRLQGSHHE